MFGRKLRGIFPEVKRKTDYPDDDKIQKHDREQKDNMKTSAGKRRRTSLKRTKRTAQSLYMIRFRWLSSGSKGICLPPRAGEGFEEETTPIGNFLKTGSGNSLQVASQMKKCSIRMYSWLNVLAVFRLTILNSTETLICACM